MPYQITRYLESLSNAAGCLDREHWIVISLVVLVMGIIFMRGFGSRTNY